MLSNILRNHHLNLNDKFYNINQNVPYYKDSKRVKSICYEIFKQTNELLPNLLIGKHLSESDFENETHNYWDFVQQLSSYFKHESKLLSHVLDKLLGYNPRGFKEIFLSKCLNLQLMEKCLQKFNLNLKKCQHISNDRWRNQVEPSLFEIVTFTFFFCFFFYPFK